MKSCAAKLTLVVAGVYALAAAPFWLGFCEPSMHEGAYSMLFTILNIPALMIASVPTEWAQKTFCPGISLHGANLLLLVAALGFWSLVAFGIGSLIDWRRKQKCPHAEKASS